MSRTKRRTKCPDCGRPATGKFCTGCGAALRGARCPKCGSRLPSGSKSCRSCGYAFGASRKSYAPAIAMAAAAVAVLAVVLITIDPLRPETPAGRALPGIRQADPSVSDLAAGTPRGEADRYFDQAMRAHETGDSARAAFAGSMALDAYARLPEPDADTRFHVGLLHEITRDHDAILAQADSIELSYPNHLFTYLLRHRVYARSGDTPAVSANSRDFLEAYEAEMATQKPEYEAHARMIVAFQSEARRAVENRDENR